ncbi:hypothetical protein [Methylorubrum sp. SB2]
MNGSFVVAFIVMPLIVLAMGYAAVRLHEWDLDRRHRNDPAE